MVKKRRLDIIILIVLIVIAIGSWIAVTVLFDVNGDYVEVIVDNHVQKVISLNDDGEYQVDDGEYSNIITIKNREVYMKSSDCPDQICVKQGKITPLYAIPIVFDELLGFSLIAVLSTIT